MLKEEEEGSVGFHHAMIKFLQGVGQPREERRVFRFRSFLAKRTKAKHADSETKHNAPH